ncbi:MAG: hypothetical protein KDD92_11865 [Caldilineaceae bacterium]|nr:hypothetical protein [Caldilineaceae bacterium]
MASLIELLHTVPWQALFFSLLVFLTALAWLVSVFRRLSQSTARESGWRRLEERVHEIRDREQA